MPVKAVTLGPIPAAARKAPRTKAVERAIFMVCSFLYMGAKLSIPPIIGMGTTGVISIGFIVSSRRARAVAKLCWPLYVMCGIALLSALWSVDPSVTVRQAFQLLFVNFLGIAMVGRLGSTEAIKVVVRAMAFTCVLSVVWVLLFPETAIHQATDAWQSVHAGLWRGVLSHKVDLGILAGLTLALLLFLGPRVSGNPASYVLGVVSATACLIGSGSSTGLVVVVTLFATLRVAAANAKQPLRIRKKLLRTLVAVISVWTGLMVSGWFDKMASMVGRSGDLTGRATYWPFVMNFLNAGNWVLGYGYGQFKYVARLIADEANLSLGEAHNGYIEMLVAFGYLFGLVVIALQAYIFWQAAHLQLGKSTRAAKVVAFPLGVMTVLLITAYIESIILAPNGVFAVLFPLVVAVCAEGMMEEKEARDLQKVVANLRRRPNPRQLASISHAPQSRGGVERS